MSRGLTERRCVGSLSIRGDEGTVIHDMQDDGEDDSSKPTVLELLLSEFAR